MKKRNEKQSALLEKKSCTLTTHILHLSRLNLKDVYQFQFTFDENKDKTIGEPFLTDTCIQQFTQRSQHFTSSFWCSQRASATVEKNKRRNSYFQNGHQESNWWIGIDFGFRLDLNLVYTTNKDSILFLAVKRNEQVT